MIVKYLLFYINLLFFASFVFADEASEITDVRNRLMDWAISYRKVGDEPRKTVAEYLELLNSDGSFSDKSSTIDIMTGRLVFMSQAFKNDSSWKGNVHLKTNLYTAVQYWLDHDPGNSGWTAGCFNEPSSMDSIGLCLYDAIQQDKIDHPEMASRLDTLVSGMVNWANASWTVANEGETFVGANIAYRLMGMIGRAALANSPEMFDEISNIVASTFTVGDYHATGILADGSWHQHNIGGGQEYWQGYGADWMNITRNSCAYMKSTRWELTDSQLNIFADCILDGWQWQIYRYQGVYPLGGRHNSLKTALYSNYIVGQIYLLRKYVGAETLIRDAELQQVKSRIENSGNSSSYPSFDASKYFYRSDLMVHGKPYHYVAVKMLSNRTAGPESGSGMGKKNYYFGEGSTMIFKTGDEYKNARVGWNFRAIPGCTIEQRTGDLPLVDWGIHNANSDNTYAGGVSDGHHGLCAFQLERSCDYSRVTAHKAYFFFNDEFAALGSMINKSPSSSYDVWTTIDQPERKTDITYSIGGKYLHTISLSTDVQMNFNNITNGAWFYCNDKGYIIFPDSTGVNVKLWAENRSGDWHDLDDRYSSGETQSVNIFQLSINHSSAPVNAKYGYLVLPDTTKESLTNYFANDPIQILENSDFIQAAQLPASNLTEIIFYKNGSIDIGNGTTVSVDRAAIVMLQRSGSQIDIMVCNPNENQTIIKFKINTLLGEKENVVRNSLAMESEITFDLPQGIYAGKSVSGSFVIIPEPFSFYQIIFIIIIFFKFN